jgi:hypothetical protein
MSPTLHADVCARRDAREEAAFVVHLLQRAVLPTIKTRRQIWEEIEEGSGAACARLGRGQTRSARRRAAHCCPHARRHPSALHARLDRKHGKPSLESDCMTRKTFRHAEKIWARRKS